MAAEFQLSLPYSQVAVFRADLENPFSDWTDENVRQGFVWREESVSFRTLAEDAEHLIRVDVLDCLPDLNPRTVRAIEVPFEVPPAGDIEIAGIMAGEALTLDPGRYQLCAEFITGGNSSPFEIHFSFARGQPERFAILTKDAELDPPEQLIVGGHAAA